MIEVIAASDWLWSSERSLLRVPASAGLALLAVIVFIRISGLRSLSKMSAFDFAVTVALGSILGSTVASSVPVSDGAVAIASLLGAQWLIAQVRRRRWGSRLVDNEPALLMRHGEFIDDALARTRVTRDDVLAKLRAANVARLEDIDAVVLETTGDITVLHGRRTSNTATDALLRGVRTGSGESPAEPHDDGRRGRATPSR